MFGLVWCVNLLETHPHLHLKPANSSLLLRVQTCVETITLLETIRLRKKRITPLLLLLLALPTYNSSSRKLQTWKELLTGTLVVAADPNPSKITSLHQNVLILNAKPQTNTWKKIIKSYTHLFENENRIFASTDVLET